MLSAGPYAACKCDYDLDIVSSRDLVATAVDGSSCSSSVIKDIIKKKLSAGVS